MKYPKCTIPEKTALTLKWGLDCIMCWFPSWHCMSHGIPHPVIQGHLAQNKPSHDRRHGGLDLLPNNSHWHMATNGMKGEIVDQFNGLMKKRHNSIAKALELQCHNESDCCNFLLILSLMLASFVLMLSNNLHSKKCIWKFHLQNGSNSIRASIC